MTSPYRNAPPVAADTEPAPDFGNTSSWARDLVAAALLGLLSAIPSLVAGADPTPVLLTLTVPMLVLSAVALVVERGVRRWLARRRARAFFEGIAKLEASAGALAARPCEPARRDSKCSKST